MTSEQKEKAVSLIHMGEKLEAVRYLQETLNIDAEQALRLTEKLEEEDEKSETSDLRHRFEKAKQEMSSSKGTNVGRTVGLIFMSVGILMLATCFYLFYNSTQFAKRAIPVMGRVVDYDSYYSTNDDGGGSTMYTPIYEYTYYGNKKTFQSSVSSSSRDFDIGEEVEILVDPDDPDEIIVNTFWDRYFAVVILGFLGSLFTGLGYMAYRLMGSASH